MTLGTMLTVAAVTVAALVAAFGFSRRPQGSVANAVGVDRVDNTAMADTDARAVQARLANGERPLLIDVREAHEWQQGHIPGARLIPLGQLTARVGEIPRDQEVIVVCRSGNRSGNACQQLRTLGYSRVRNLRGGMLQWVGSVER